MRRLVVAVAMVLGVASTARADCAWIGWWVTTELDDRKTTAIIASYAGAGDCVSDLDRREGVYRGSESLFAVFRSVSMPTKLVVIPKGETAVAKSYVYFCLPDTMDPRSLEWTE